MAYCSVEDLLNMISREELVALTAEAGEEPDSTVIGAAIAKAEDEINAYVAGRYQVPLAPVPPQILGVAVDLTLYHLYSRRSVMPAVRRQRYEAALMFLRLVAAGQVHLEEAAGQGEKAGQPAEMTGGVRLFSRSSLGDW
jgi:phage gp36-like protein